MGESETWESKKKVYQHSCDLGRKGMQGNDQIWMSQKVCEYNLCHGEITAWQPSPWFLPDFVYQLFHHCLYRDTTNFVPGVLSTWLIFKGQVWSTTHLYINVWWSLCRLLSSKSPRIDPVMSTESLAMLTLSEKLVLATARKREPRGKVWPC